MDDPESIGPRSTEEVSPTPDVEGVPPEAIDGFGAWYGSDAPEHADAARDELHEEMAEHVESFRTAFRKAEDG